MLQICVTNFDIDLKLTELCLQAFAWTAEVITDIIVYYWINQLSYWIEKNSCNTNIGLKWTVEVIDW